MNIIEVLIALMIPQNVFAEIKLSQIKLPEHFKIEVFVDGIDGARSMTWGKNGTLFVGTRGNKVYAIDAQKKLYVLAKKLNSPNGVAFRDGSLFVAENHQILKFDNIEGNLSSPPVPQVIAKYPDESNHGWKFIAFGPDGRLYVPQGAPCNICEIKDPYAALTSIKSDGSDYQVYARGIRNTVGFDWNPLTKEHWFTDNGRDWLGNNNPPDELNHAPKAGMHFGYPFCHGGDTLDPEFGKNRKCETYTAPVQKLGPHVAALGMRFYTGKMFPSSYQNHMFIAEHGSWNRSEPLGYRITTVSLDKNGKPKGYEVFADGWLHSGSAWGRPVDVINAPDGALLVSDDQANAIYRISYQKK